MPRLKVIDTLVHPVGGKIILDRRGTGLWFDARGNGQLGINTVINWGEPDLQ